MRQLLALASLLFLMSVAPLFARHPDNYHRPGVSVAVGVHSAHGGGYSHYGAPRSWSSYRSSCGCGRYYHPSSKDYRKCVKRCEKRWKQYLKKHPHNGCSRCAPPPSCRYHY